MALEMSKTIYRKKWQSILGLLVSIAALILLLLSRENTIIKFVGIVFCLTIALYESFQLLNPKHKWVDPDSEESIYTTGEDFNLIFNDEGIFDYQDEGFNIQFEDGKKFIYWKDIKTIYAYKRDLYTYDELNLQIDYENSSFKISENIKGWYKFVEKIKEIYPNIRQDFDIQLMFPAFEQNLTVVYDYKNRRIEEIQNN